MICSGTVKFHPETMGDSAPELGSELGPRSEEMSDRAPKRAIQAQMNPSHVGGPRRRQQYDLRSPGGFVDHHEEVGEPVGRGQRSHQVYVNMAKTPFGH
ncbi:hypothetical protein AAFF_G00084220 [Aldrovandia affinis]|uniref:Uncharacterized protein n=1 Tax=Aldrovandia affinis TaxID=143900 RepID=A0AAD7RX06_9TELE|nr:hypothetical protein AAFF_G00084220 [Aldrovandia affinis]